MAIFNVKNSSNPFLKESALQKSSIPVAGVSHETMTVKGAIDKTLILFVIMMITTVVSYSFPSNIFIFVGAIGGLIAVIIASLLLIMLDRF